MSEHHQAVTDGEPSSDRASGGSGDETFAAFYARQWRPMVELAYLTVGSREQAEDLVQEAFARVHQRWSRVDQPAAYLRTTVVNLGNDTIRRLVRYRAREPRLLGPSGTEDSPDELWDALARLKPRQRAALVLRYYEGLQEPEIAAALGVRAGTVKSLLHRGLEQLRKEITP